MSLIVTSSSQNDNYEGIGSINIEQPYSYQNYFKTPIKIKPNSEIAVESCKVFKNTNINLLDSDKMSFYFGKELTLESSNLLSYPIHLNFNTNLINFTDFFRSNRDVDTNLSFEEAARRIQTCLKESVLHPVLYDKPRVEVTFNSTTGLTQGFTMIFDQRSASGVTNIISENFISADPNTEDVNFDYNGGTFTQQSATADLEDNECCGIAVDRPLLNSSGIIEFDISEIEDDGSEHWVVGLCRSLRPPDGYNPNIPDYYAKENDDTGFCDFFVKWDGGSIKVGYMAADSDQEEIFYYDKVEYYHSGGDFTAPITDLTKYTAIRFVLKNEIMEVQIYDSTTAKYMGLVSRDLSTDKDKIFKPISQVTWTLFPFIQLATQNSEITIAEQSGLDHSSSYDPSIMNWYTLATVPIDQDFKEATWNVAAQQDQFVKVIDTLKINDPTDGLEYTPLGVNASAINEYKFVLLMGENNIYNNSRLDGFKPNVNRKFGFGLKSIIDQTVYGSASGSIVTFASLTKSDILSTRSFFIRLNTGTHTSYNGAMSGISKILAHFPTTKEGGITEGILYFEKSNLIYLDLNNPTEISLQNLKIDLVYSDETFAECFGGNTIVTFHIREKIKDN